MNIKDIEIFSNKISGKFYFDYDLKKTNWFNIGGKSKIFFKPEKLEELIEFLKIYKNRSKIFIIGAGSNILISDKLYDGVIIKLGRNFSKISLLNETTIIAGSSASDKQVSEFAKENNIGGFEYLSCIPGSVGGGIRMNTGCFNHEIKDTLVSVQAVNFSGQVISILKKDIKFNYRECNSVFTQSKFGKVAKSGGPKYTKHLSPLRGEESCKPFEVIAFASTWDSPKGSISGNNVWGPVFISSRKYSMH